MTETITELEDRVRQLEASATADALTLEQREDIEAIKALKYRYFRTLDHKLWDEMADCFAPGATTSYYDERYQPEDVGQIMGFLKHSMGRFSLFGFHHGHQPEIEITGPSTARGRWFLYNYMIDTKYDTTMLLAAIYEDEYVKADGQWKIAHTCSTRIVEEKLRRSSVPSLEIRANVFEGRQSGSDARFK